MANQAMFPNANNVQFSGGTFTQTYGNKSPLEALHEKSAPGAFHNSQERFDSPKCHPDTRVAVVEDIVEQIKIAVVSTIIWLYGAAGAGKSSIAQTIAEMCNKEKLLNGSFFFFRTAPLRNNAKRLAASLAYQLGRTIPSTLQYIAAYIETDPAIFDCSLEDQLLRLFIEPLHQAFESNPQSCPDRALLVLDGLDECDTPQVQRYILKVLGKILPTTPIPIIVLIASRPETHISSIFDSLEELSNITTFPIGLNDKYDADGDIRIYTNDRLKQIKRSHHLRTHIPEDWPTPQDIEWIVHKASGQFIFAATIVRFLESSSHLPNKQLQIAIDSSQRFSSEVSKSPFAALDALYLQILSGVGDDQVIVLAILYHILDIKPFGSTFTAYSIARCFHFDPGEVQVHLSSLTSLVKFEPEPDLPIRIYHASLRDFLLDEGRSQSFYILQTGVIVFLAKTYLKYILSGDCELSRDIPVVTGFLHLVPSNNQEIHIILRQLEQKLPTILYNYLAEWRQHFIIPTAFGKLVTDQEKMCITVKARFENIELWNQCLRSIHEFLKLDLQAYLGPSSSLELLAYMAFATDIGRESTHEFFTNESETLLKLFVDTCFGVKIIPKCLSVAHSLTSRRSILQNFLLDKSLSGNLAISPACFAQATLKCAQYLDLRIQRNENLGFSVRHEQFALYGLTMLDRAARDDQLIKLRQTLQSRITSSGLEDGAVLSDALASYLKKYPLSETMLDNPLPLPPPPASEVFAIQGGVKSLNIAHFSRCQQGDLQTSLSSDSHLGEIHPPYEDYLEDRAHSKTHFEASPLSESHLIENNSAAKKFIEHHPSSEMPAIEKITTSEVPLDDQLSSGSHLQDPPVKLSQRDRHFMTKPPRLLSISLLPFVMFLMLHIAGVHTVFCPLFFCAGI
ncbi:hypothetical protein CPB83DRAFT_910074 [Crepidotus variabilis]|uniref:NACHT domain-containing protein n=1 Tax=Crepidotus variabilis TaxID=179855 RepID=A0A9P6E870_9AGAR|nr:hypothetical protein CPB83DRAFT_910074 [Crepidotus variabilis]